MNYVVIIIIIAAIGLAFGLIIYLANAKLPYRVKNIDRIEAIKKALPSTDCRECGYEDCFTYAQALAKKPEMANEMPCPVILQSQEALSHLEKVLGVSLDAPSKKALIHCGGKSEAIFNYSGTRSCRAATLLLSGYKRCPYACLGLGDCLTICPKGAISLDEERGIAIIDYDRCNGCGLCVAECPQNLIEMLPAETKVALRCNYGRLEDISSRERCDYARQFVL
jgi:Na+-translocating ferredoxin:NAD+ oxidoreductase RNF subunit RnfB